MLSVGKSRSVGIGGVHPDGQAADGGSVCVGAEFLSCLNAVTGTVHRPLLLVLQC